MRLRGSVAFFLLASIFATFRQKLAVPSADLVVPSADLVVLTSGYNYLATVLAVFFAKLLTY